MRSAQVTLPVRGSENVDPYSSGYRALGTPTPGNVDFMLWWGWSQYWDPLGCWKWQIRIEVPVDPPHLHKDLSKNGIAPSYFQLETLRSLPWSACLANHNTPPLFWVILRITCLANNFWNQRQCLPSEPRAFCSQRKLTSFWGSRESRQVHAPQERLGYPELKVLLLEENPLPLQLCPGWGSQDTGYK